MSLRAPRLCRFCEVDVWPFTRTPSGEIRWADREGQTTCEVYRDRPGAILFHEPRVDAERVTS